MAQQNLVTITSPDMFTKLMEQNLERVTLLNFWAPWAQPCERMNSAVAQYASEYPQAMFMNIEAEEQLDVSESFDIEAVPTIVLLRGHTLLAKISGANVNAVGDALAAHVSGTGGKARSSLAYSGATPQAPDGSYATGDGRAHGAPATLDMASESPEETERRCRELMNRSKVMLFMKGQPSAPQCGFSHKTVALLREQNVDFDYYNILTDENVRQKLKVINEWPTFPQIIVNGELIGGLDILKEQIATGEFRELLGS